MTSAAATAEDIEGQARDALASALEAMQEQGQTPPATVEEAGLPAYDLDAYERPLVLLIASPDMARVAA